MLLVEAIKVPYFMLSQFVLRQPEMCVERGRHAPVAGKMPHTL